MILAFMMEMLTLAPQYSTFGTQQFSAFSTQGEVPCDLSLISSNQDSECRMTNISQFYNKLSISIPFFSTIFYLANWMLIAMIGLSLLHGICYKEEDDIEEIVDTYDEEKVMLKYDD